MKIRRFCAPDIRQAIRLVREELGADAVILSNRKVEEGIEIVAAMDFDQELFQEQIRESNGKDCPIPAATASVAGSQRSSVATGRAPVREHPDRDDRDGQRIAKHLEPGPEQTVSAALSRNRAKPVSVAKASLNDEPDLEPILAELRKEFDGIRRLLDSHIADVSWAESARRDPICREIFRRLNHLGFSEALGRKITKQIDPSSEVSSAWENVKRSVDRHLKVHEDNLLHYGGIVALVGPTGVGKTTSIAKLAAKFCLKYGPRKIVLVTADNYRIGAYEQLNTYGRILDIPVRTAHDNAELEKVLRQSLDKRLVLIDTAGVSQRSMNLIDRFPVLQGEDLPVRSYLVMSAPTQYPAIKEIIQVFKVFRPYGAILTKLDEAVAVGSAVSALIESQLPLSFVCDGQKVPENLKTAMEFGLVQRCFAEVSRPSVPVRAAHPVPPGQRIQACG